MQLSDKIKKFSVEQAIDYRNKNRSRTCRSSSTGRTRSAPESSRASAAPSARRAWIPPMRTTRWCSTCSTTLTRGAQDHARELLHLRHLLVLHERELGRHLVRGVFPAAHRPRLPAHLVFPLHAGRQRCLAKQAAAAAKKKQKTADRKSTVSRSGDGALCLSKTDVRVGRGQRSRGAQAGEIPASPARRARMQKSLLLEEKA